MFTHLVLQGMHIRKLRQTVLDLRMELVTVSRLARATHAWHASQGTYSGASTTSDGTPPPTTPDPPPRSLARFLRS